MEMKTSCLKHPWTLESRLSNIWEVALRPFMAIIAYWVIPLVTKSVSQRASSHHVRPESAVSVECARACVRAGKRPRRQDDDEGQ